MTEATEHTYAGFEIGQKDNQAFFKDPHLENELFLSLWRAHP